MEGYLGVIFGLAAGALLVAAGFPLKRHMIGPNRWYGFRTPPTLNDEQTWLAVNAQTGKHLTALGGILICCGLFGLLAPHDPKQQRMLVVTCVAVIAVGLVYSLLSGWRMSRSMETTNQSFDC